MNYVRIHVIPTANDDGSKANGVTADHIAQSIDYANDVYKSAGIFFVFDPQTDLDPIRRNTLLNQDMLEVPNAENYPPDKCPGDSSVCDAEKDRIGSEYPGKLVIFYGSGDRYYYNAEANKWEFGPSSHWSNDFNSFVRILGIGMPLEKVPHEMGHYLHIGHPFRELPKTKSEASEIIRRYVDDDGHPKERGTDAFDGDVPYVNDTPPDPGIDLFKRAGLDPCNQQSVLKLTVALRDGKQNYDMAPNYNIMSYWGACENLRHYVSKDQIARIREALEKENRNHLIAARVLYDGVWEPSDPGQTRVLGWGQADFAVRFDKELARNRCITHMQAYDMGGGQIRWDGVWQPGNNMQTRAIGWAFNDFAGRFDQELSRGKHLVHMQAYDMGGGQIRWDGVWESGDRGQTRALGWALGDFAKKFNEEIARGQHATHVQAYDMGSRQIRWDGVWERGDKGQTRALCWSLKDFAVRFDQELSKGRHLVHMQAYDIGGGKIRWDGVWESGVRGQTRALCWALNDFINRFNQELSDGKHLVHMQAYDIGGGQMRWDGVWEPGKTGQTRAFGLSLSDFAVLLDNQLASNKKIVHMQAYLRK